MAMEGLFVDQVATETFQEYASSAGRGLSVDTRLGVVPGVKILGLVSKNDREYTPECATKATPIYEGASVFVDHLAKGETRRSYHDRIGTLRNVSYRPTEQGLFADFHYNPKHPLAEQLAWDAMHAPENVGFSHDAEGKVRRTGGKTIVEEIISVNSVDLVAKPATTRGLYESDELPGDPQHRELCEHGLSAASDTRSILLGHEPIDTKKARLLEVLAVWRAELSGTSRTKEFETMEWKGVTIEGLKEHRADLVAVLTGTDETSKLAKQLQEAQDAMKEATDKLAVLEAKEAKQAKSLKIAEELKVAKIDTSNKTLCSESFMAAMEVAPDEAARKSLIDDRLAVARVAYGDSTMQLGTAPFAPVGGSRDDGRKPAVNKAELLAQL